MKGEAIYEKHGECYEYGKQDWKELLHSLLSERLITITRVLLTLG